MTRGGETAQRRATLHKGSTWWVIPEGAIGFNEMRNGFKSRDEALAWAESNGYEIEEYQS